jgi:hypothetical protein
MYGRKFWTAAVERATKTLAQTLLTVLPIGVGIADLPWLAGLSIAASAAVLSLLTSVGSAQVRDDTPSLVGDR